MTTPATPERPRGTAAPTKKAARASKVLASKQGAQAPAKKTPRTSTRKSTAPSALASTPGARTAPAAPATTAQGSRSGLAARQGSVSKVSVSLPDALARSVRDRVGPGRFSSYVAAAVERQLELDRLAELVDGFEQRLGRPIRDDLMTEAEATWHGE